MKKFELIYRAKWSVDGAKTIDEMMDLLFDQVNYLSMIKAMGGKLVAEIEDDYGFIEIETKDKIKIKNLLELGFSEEEND